MFNLKRLMSSTGAQLRTQEHADSAFETTEKEDHSVAVEYEALIAAQFRRFGIDPRIISLEARKVGEMGHGLDVVAGMVRILTWDRISALRLLLGLPMLEAKVRQAVSATWLADVSHFSGLWLNTSHDLHHAEGASELRDLIVHLARRPKAGRPGGSSNTDSHAACSVRKLLLDSSAPDVLLFDHEDEAALTDS